MGYGCDKMHRHALASTIRPTIFSIRYFGCTISQHGIYYYYYHFLDLEGLLVSTIFVVRLADSHGTLPSCSPAAVAGLQQGWVSSFMPMTPQWFLHVI